MTPDLVPLAEPLFAEGLRLGLLPPLDRALVLDTEFMTVPGVGRRIFGLGLGWVRESRPDPFALFTWSPPSLVEVGCRRLKTAAQEQVPILTWNGASADLAAAECLIPGILWERWRIALRPRHLDLYHLVRRHRRALGLEAGRLRLKTVAEALGIPRRVRGVSAWQVARYWDAARHSTWPDSTWQGRALRRYLLEDVRLLYAVAVEVAARLARRAGDRPNVAEDGNVMRAR